MSDPITRSGSNYSAPRDSNRVPFMLGASSADGETPLPVEINPSDSGVLVHVIGSGITGNVNLADVGGSPISLGQKTMSASLPVTLASDQSSLNIGNISGTISLPTNAAQETGGNLATLATGVTSSHYVVNNTQINGSAIVTSATGVQKIGVSGASGATLDAVKTAATAPANGLLTLGIYNSTEPSPTTGQSVGIQLDSKGRIRQVIMDAAGNTRGANVNASNQLSVSIDGSSATNISTNLAQVAGATVATGHGTASGALRVELPTDGTGQVNVAQSTASNLNATVSQATGNNLHVVVDSGTISSPALPGTLVSFVTSITTAGTRVQLGSNSLSQGIVIEAPSTNTGVIYVGGSTVSSSSYGAELQPGQSVGLAVNNTNLVYVDTATNGNKVSVLGS